MCAVVFCMTRCREMCVFMFVGTAGRVLHEGHARLGWTADDTTQPGRQATLRQ